MVQVRQIPHLLLLRVVQEGGEGGVAGEAVVGSREAQVRPTAQLKCV